MSDGRRYMRARRSYTRDRMSYMNNGRSYILSHLTGEHTETNITHLTARTGLVVTTQNKTSIIETCGSSGAV